MKLTLKTQPKGKTLRGEQRHSSSATPAPHHTLPSRGSVSTEPASASLPAIRLSGRSVLVQPPSQRTQAATGTRHWARSRSTCAQTQTFRSEHVPTSIFHVDACSGMYMFSPRPSSSRPSPSTSHTHLARSSEQARGPRNRDHEERRPHVLVGHVLQLFANRIKWVTVCASWVSASEHAVATSSCASQRPYSCVTGTNVAL